mgnify:CR=1 FL=1
MAAARDRTENRCLGVILAGGASRRMGGGDKALADLGGRPLLAHVIARFQPQVTRLILNANGPPQRFSQFGLPVVPDLDGRALGPLAGLLAAMEWAARTDPALTAIAAVTSDVPFLPADLVSRLAVAAGSGVAIAVSSGRRHPTIGLWPLALKADIAAALARDDLSVNAFASRHSAVEVSFPFSETDGAMIDPFFNANTPDDLAEARRIVAHAM